MQPLRRLLVPAFVWGVAVGCAMTLAFGAAWLLFDRELTTRAAAACATVGVSSGVSAAVALIATQFVNRRRWSARFAVAFLILITGTGALTSAVMGVHAAWSTHPLLELPPKIVLVILLTSSVAALYGFLTIAGFLILPFGMPVLVLTAALMAAKRR